MIRSLAYVGFTSPNAKEWRSFGPEVLGAQLVPSEPGDVVLRVDEAAWRIAIHQGDTNDLGYIGWDVGDAGGLEVATRQLADAGHSVNQGEAGLAADRQVEAIAWFSDPFGFRHELTYGLHQAAEPFAPGRAMEGGFLTGEGGLGHLVLMVPDVDQASQFFQETLGFGHSDDVDMGIQVRFLHCNPRHHTLAFSGVPGMVGVHHLMLEVERSHDVVSAYDIVNERDMTIAMTLGRHTNDGMFSFYVRTPSGFEVEYGAGARLVDTSANTPPGHYDSVSVWGHEPPAERLFPGILRSIEA